MAVLAFDTAAKMRRSVYMRSYVLADGDIRPEVKNVRLNGAGHFVVRYAVQPPSAVDDHNLMLEIYGIADDDFDFSKVTVEVDVSTGDNRETLACDQDSIDRQFLHPKYTVHETWTRLMGSDRIKTVIDIGGRARSGISRKEMFPGKTIKVADILASPDVDYVCDVHELSSHVTESFDAFMSIATFEHLLMPWKAAIEINKVLNPGAIGVVVTHQTTGIHDVPWDYYRYSDNAWKGVFNHYTGFEIVDSGMVQPAMIIPRRWHQAHEGTEHAVGYLTSSVVVRKISRPKIDWPVAIPSITRDAYPE